MDYSGIEIDNLNLTNEELLRIYDDAIEGGGPLIAASCTSDKPYTYYTYSPNCSYGKLGIYVYYSSSSQFYKDDGTGYCSSPDVYTFCSK